MMHLLFSIHLRQQAPSPLYAPFRRLLQKKTETVHVHSHSHSFSPDCNVFLGIDAGSQKAELEPTLHNCVGHIMNNSPAQTKS